MQEEYFALEIKSNAIIGRLYLPDDKKRYPAVCICHGVPSGNPPDPMDGGYPALAERICREGFAVSIFNFRGTGDSGGNLDILDWTHDLKAVIDHLWELETIDRSYLALVGFSAGAAVSIYTAAQDKRVSRVAACACPADFSLFTEAEQPRSNVDRLRRIGAIKDDDFPPSIEEWLGNFRAVTPIDHASGIAPRPLLLVHGNRDETVDVSHARRLYEKAGEPKEIVIIDGVGHRLRQEERAVSTVLEWLNSGR